MTTTSHNPRTRFGALLRELRTSHEPPITQLALGRHAHVSADAVATWEKGRSLPNETTVQALDARLDANGRLHRAWQEADTRPDRPTATGARLSAASLLASSAQEAASFGSWAEVANTGAVAIASITQRVNALSDGALTRPPAEIVAEAAAINHTLFELLRGHHKPGHGRDLYTAAGTACALLSWLSGDLGNTDAARIHGATAQICADMAENPELSGWVAAVRSKTAFWAGEYVAAANLARAGTVHLAPGTVQVMLACQQADAWARLGAAEETAAALDQARRAADSVRGVDSFGGLFTCGAGRALNYAAGCNIAIARNAAALAAADAALEVFRSDGHYGFGTVAQTHVSKTLAYANAGDLDAAASAARPVLDLPPERRLSTVSGRLAPLARALDAPSLRTSRVAGPLREEIVAFCTGSGQRAIDTGKGSQ